MKRLIPLAALLIPSALAAQGFTQLPTIDRAVADFTGVAIGQSGGAAQPVDRRLRLAACAGIPALSWYGARRDTVLVQCPDAGSWRLFVPVLAGNNAASQVPAVLRGEAVTIAVEGDGFSVAQAGEAMEPGAVGSWIKVKSANANAQPMRARVVRPGLVMVDIGSALP
ncbi:MAG: flagella basal body P-ring formation protein FlgA [Novosphingobium sp.]